MRRSGPLQRKTPLRAKRPAPTDELTRIAQLAFWQAGLAQCTRDKQGRYICPVCEQRFPRAWMQVHHLISQEAIRRHVASLRLEASRMEGLLRRRLWDARNAFACCRICHAQHTVATVRIPLRLVPERAWEFADEMGLTYLLTRYYPA